MTTASLRALLAAATGSPRPWFNAYNRVCSRPLFEQYDDIERTMPADIADDDPRWEQLPDIDVCGVDTCAGDTPSHRGQSDADLIVAAVNSLPSLLAIAELVEQYLETKEPALIAKMAMALAEMEKG